MSSLSIFTPMKTTTQILPGIKAIGWLECDKLPDRVDLMGICRQDFGIFTDIHPMEFFDEPDCSCKRTKEGGSYSETASLKFQSSVPLPQHPRLGFVVTDISGQSYLIGSKEAPRPIVEVEQNTGSPGGDAASFYYEVKHTALKTLIPCYI